MMVCDDPVRVLDGGMGRQLEQCGAPFRQPEWSALALMEAPETVVAAHAAFIDAGADMVTTNSYALVPFHIGQERFDARGAELVALSGRLARQAADAAGRKVRVAGCLPPLFGSYEPSLFDPEKAPAMLAMFVETLAPHVDVFLAETMSCIEEALAACAAAKPAGKPVWVSFTLAEDGGPPRLRSGEGVAMAVRAAQSAGAAAILFNCSKPEVMGPAVDAARRMLGESGIAIGVYANAFAEGETDGGANEGISGLREDLTPARYRAWADDWRKRGATMVGGCCGIGPAHIAALR